MDRNIVTAFDVLAASVALRKESVDRNCVLCVRFPASLMSLSARRAWIEINFSKGGLLASVVALRKESVDRNIPRGQLPTPEPPSLSARRAWIEISRAANCQHRSHRRSPQGERG